MSKLIDAGSPVRVLITVTRDAAVRAGKSRYGTLLVELDPSELTLEQRETLLTCRTYKYQSGNVVCDQCPDVTCEAVPAVDGSLEEIKRSLDALSLRRVAKEQEEKKKKAEGLELLTAGIEKFLALPQEECFSTTSSYKYGVYSNYFKISTEAENLIEDRWQQYRGHSWKSHERAEQVKAKLEALKLEIARRNQEIEQQAKEAQAREESRKAEAEAANVLLQQAQKTQIAAWLDLHGTANQKARLAAGVLPDQEVVDRIRDEAFAPLNHLDRYQRLTAKDVCTCNYDTCRVEYSTDTAETMTADQWEGAEQIKAALPTATVELRVHEGTSQECGNSVLRYSYHVSLESGAFTFSREYGAPSTERDDNDAES